jgi:hypothetical protein
VFVIRHRAGIRRADQLRCDGRASELYACEQANVSLPLYSARGACAVGRGACNDWRGQTMTVEVFLVMIVGAVILRHVVMGLMNLMGLLKHDE